MSYVLHAGATTASTAHERSVAIGTIRPTSARFVVTWHRRRPAPLPRPRPAQAVLDALRALPGLRRHDAPGPRRGPDFRWNAEVTPVRPRRPSVGALRLGGVRGHRRDRPHPRPSTVRHHHGSHDDGRGRRDRGGRRLDAVRHAAALPQGHRRAGTARADPRTAVRALRDPVDRHRGDDAPGPRRLHHRLGQRPGRPPLRRTLRLRRVRRSRRAVPERARARRPPRSPCASRACRP